MHVEIKILRGVFLIIIAFWGYVQSSEEITYEYKYSPNYVEKIDSISVLDKTNNKSEKFLSLSKNDSLVEKSSVDNCSEDSSFLPADIDLKTISIMLDVKESEVKRLTVKRVFNSIIGTPPLIVGGLGLVVFGVTASICDDEDDDYNEPSNCGPLYLGLLGSLFVAGGGAYFVGNAIGANKDIKLLKSQIRILNDKKSQLSYINIIPSYSIPKKLVKVSIVLTF